ncbi:hypothetical protein RAK27_13570 [Carnobacterium maltaromaticum]|uniref:Uncharacterized protein n=1 Tax=Carnobacterium maltaromaticum TaxID=2751 RepID=A0AAW9K1P9_CARML|nr:hypothetical protein [Carnobacterium maltaromaticum]MDZ5759686.1 hypothetical protein [Carnobacterium maltaromaticum]
MKYLKPMNYVRSCLLFGCLFSFKVLASPQVSVEEENIYIYELDIEYINFGETVVVDPLNPTVEVEPLPPTYTPRNNIVERIKNNYSISPPNGEIPILIQKNSKKFKKVSQCENHGVKKNELILSVSGGGSSSDNPEMLYMEELYIALSGNLLYGDKVIMGKEKE